MHSQSRKTLFTLCLLLSTNSIAEDSSMIASPAPNPTVTRTTQNEKNFHTMKQYYKDTIVKTTQTYANAVNHCIRILGTNKGCNAGTNHIPPAILTTRGLIANLSVIDGKITVTPAPKNGLDATDTLVATPRMDKNDIDWDFAGGSVKKGYIGNNVRLSFMDSGSSLTNTNNSCPFASEVDASNTPTPRAFFCGVVAATQPYRKAVDDCAKALHTLIGCNAGTNHIPAAINSPTGVVATLTVENGVISVTPVPTNGVEATDDYILTPGLDADDNLTWTPSGVGEKYTH